LGFCLITDPDVTGATLEKLVFLQFGIISHLSKQ